MRVLRYIRNLGIVVLITLVVVGIAVAIHRMRPPHYTAEAVLVVPSNSGSPSGSSDVVRSGRSRKTIHTNPTYQGPGLEDQAQNLATTFASLIPEDQSVLRAASRQLGGSTSYVQSRLTAVNTANTSLVRVDYSGDSPSAALLGAISIARDVSGSHPVSPAIPPGSLVLVHLPTTTTTAYTEAVLVGIAAVLGVALGLLLVVVLDRANPRLETPRDVAALLDLPVIAASRLSGEVADRLVWDWYDIAAREQKFPEGSLVTAALVPTTKASELAAQELAARLTLSHDQSAAHETDGADTGWSPSPTALRAQSALVSQASPIHVDAVALGKRHSFDLGSIVDHDLLVLVIARGTNARQVSTTVDHLAEVGRAPHAAVLTGRKASELPAS